MNALRDLRSIRLAQHKTLEEMAREVGTDKSYLSRLENNKYKRVSSRILVGLSKAYCLPITVLQSMFAGIKVFESDTDTDILPFIKMLGESTNLTRLTPSEFQYLLTTKSFLDIEMTPTLAQELISILRNRK